MKKLLILVCVLFSIQVFAQPVNYTWYKQRTRQYSLMLDSMFFPPSYNGTPSGFRVGENSARDGAFAIDTANSRAYIYSGGAWVRVANYSDVTALATIYTADGAIAGTRTVDGGNFNFTWNNARNITYNMNAFREFKILGTSGGNTEFKVEDGAIYLYTDNTGIVNQSAVDIAPDIAQMSTAKSGDYATTISRDNGTNLEAATLIHPANSINYGIVAENAAKSIKIGKAIAINSNNFRGFRIDSLWQIYMDSIDAGPGVYALRIDAAGKITRADTTVGGGGGSYTASNGLTLVSSDFQLGGTLGSNTSITFDGNYLAFPDISAFADTTNWKPMVVNTTGSGGATGEVRKATYWPTGSGGSGATVALDNLSSVAINAALVLGTSDAFALGSTSKQWSDLFLAEGGVINWDNGDATLTQVGNNVTLAGADLNVTTGVIYGDGTTANILITTGGGAKLNYGNQSVSALGSEIQLTYSTTGHARWGVGADGLGSFFPVDDDQRNLGASTTRWQDLYLSRNLFISATAVGTSGDGVLVIGNGTIPSTSPANSIQLYAEDVAASSELKVRDEAGNITVLSPTTLQEYPKERAKQCHGHSIQRKTENM